jgi:hypothetical protein
MRVTIRFSLNSDTDSALGNKLKTALRNAGFAIAAPPDTMVPGTATYEVANMQVSQLGPVLQQFWDAAANHGRPWVPCSLLDVQCRPLSSPRWSTLEPIAKYQSIAQHRLKAAASNVILADGFEG